MTATLRDLVGVVLTLMVTLTTLTQSTNLISSDLQGRIVDLHNGFRTSIKAKKMLELRWDDPLAAEAQDWVSQCDFRHKENNTRGENIYRSELNSPVADVAARGVMSWTVEISYMMVSERSGDPCCDAEKNTTLCCNYQQMVWSDTRKVGCGLKRCVTLKGPDKDYSNAWFFACFYDPPGNVSGEKVYERAGSGKVCSACPYIFNRCKDSLCIPSAFCRGMP